MNKEIRLRSYGTIKTLYSKNSTSLLRALQLWSNTNKQIICYDDYFSIPEKYKKFSKFIVIVIKRNNTKNGEYIGYINRYTVI